MLLNSSDDASIASGGDDQTVPIWQASVSILMAASRHRAILVAGMRLAGLWLRGGTARRAQAFEWQRAEVTESRQGCDKETDRQVAARADEGQGQASPDDEQAQRDRQDQRGQGAMGQAQRCGGWRDQQGQNQ